MRPHPDIPTTLVAAARRLEEEASRSSDATLRDRTLVPLAMLLRRTATEFDTYVADRLSEIDCLAELVTEAIPLIDPGLHSVLEDALPDDATAGGRSPASALDATTDRLHRALIVAAANLEETPDESRTAVLERIWQVQTPDHVVAH